MSGVSRWGPLHGTPWPGRRRPAEPFFVIPPRPFSASNNPVLPLLPADLCQLVDAALREDQAASDATTLALVPPDRVARAAMVLREPGVLAGLDLALAAFPALHPGARVTRHHPDGADLPAHSVVLTVEGPASTLLSAERVALNFVQRLSGIATLTRQFVRALEGTHTRLLDTRKTTPGWRRLEKYAVTCGGGVNHRQSLADLILIKDNHLAALHDATPNPIAAAVQRARTRFPHLTIEVEADTLDQVQMALDAGADFILLDNMSLGNLRTAVEQCRGRALTEASGGVRLDTVRAIAETGVDFVSVGALTHSARALDLGLDFLP